MNPRKQAQPQCGRGVEGGGRLNQCGVVNNLFTDTRDAILLVPQNPIPKL